MKLGDFSLLDEDDAAQTELREKIAAFNRTGTKYPRDLSVPAQFAEQVRRAPHAIAVIEGEKRFTYAEVAAQANRIARLLVQEGLRSEEFVAVMAGSAFDLVTAFLGLLQAGGAYLPLDPDLPVERMQFMLRDTRARFFIGARKHLPAISAPAAGNAELAVLVCPDCDQVGGVEGGAGWAKRLGARELAVQSPEALADRSMARSLAHVIYTSGTTGQPKGVLIEHCSIVRLVVETNYLHVGPEDRWLMTGALSFDASTLEIWGALLNGAALCRPPEHAVLDPEVMKALIQRWEITTLFLTTSLLNQLADADVTLFTGLKRLLTGGEKMSVHHANKIHAGHPGIVLTNLYGPTENTTVTTSFVVDRPQSQDVPIGRPIANTSVYLLDDNLHQVDIGAAGEICAGGDGLARGYLNQEKLSREKFIAHPWIAGERLYRTGDLGRYRVDGVIEYLGRKDDQVKIRGFRIEPGEIEVRLSQHPGVREAIVLARDLPGEGLVLVAYVTGDASLTAETLRARLVGQLPEAMIPTHFVVMPAFPLMPNGKANRRALPAPARTVTEPREHVAPETDTERAIAAIWGEVLDRPGVGVTENFFAAGGHSLKVTKLVALIRKRLGVEVSLVTVFKAATIREQAQVVRDSARFGVEGIDDPIVKLNAGNGPPVFAFPPGTGDALGYVQLAHELLPYSVHGFNFIPAETRLAEYANLIQQVQPKGPYVLLGYSAGANLAFHVAAELERRGERVGGVVMIDSGRVKQPIIFPEGEVERVTADFLDHESIRTYVATPVLREKAAGLIASYYAYMGRTLDDHTIAGDIYQLVSSEPGEHLDAEGRLCVSRAGWADATRGRHVCVEGTGDHNHILAPPHLGVNAQQLKQFFLRIFSTSGR